MTDSPAAILVVDDAPINRRLLQSLLVKQGHTVSLAQHGKEALAVLRESRPDLILLDLMMPVLDGFAVLDQLSHHVGPHDFLPNSEIHQHSVLGL